MFYHPVDSSAEFLKGKTLVVPVVSVANVGQLAADLLIVNLDLKLIGVFNARDLIPVIGGREDGREGITTPLELFGREGVQIVVIQQRSPVLKSRKAPFVSTLLAFIQEYHLASALFLAGMDMSNRTDQQMTSPIYQLTPPHSPPLLSTPLSQIPTLPAYTFLPGHPSSLSPDAPSSAPSTPTPIPFIPAGGLTHRLLSSLPQGWPTPTAALLQFVLEGDNRPDAMFLASTVAKLLNVDSLVVGMGAGNGKGWKEPASWKYGLFGTPLREDDSLFG